MVDTRQLQREIAGEIARRAGQRLQVLAAEAPDVLARRLASWGADDLYNLLELSRLPEPLLEREPPRRHVGVAGVDHCTERLLAAEQGLPAEPEHRVKFVDARPSELDDDDLVAARDYVPETLPGYLLG